MFFAIRFCRKQIAAIYKSAILGIDLFLALLIFCFPQINLYFKNIDLFTRPGWSSYMKLEVGKWFYIGHLFAMVQIIYGIYVIYKNLRQEKDKKALRKVRMASGSAQSCDDRSASGKPDGNSARRI